MPSLTKITAAAPCSLALASFRAERGVLRGLRAVERALLVLLLRLFAEHDDDLAFDVDPGIIVVRKGLLAAFQVLRGDAIAGENQRRIELARFRRWPAA